MWSHPKNSCRVYMYIFIQLDRDSYELVIILPSSTLTAVNTGIVTGHCLLAIDAGHPAHHVFATPTVTPTTCVGNGNASLHAK